MPRPVHQLQHRLSTARQPFYVVVSSLSYIFNAFQRRTKSFAETCATSLSQIPVHLPGNNCHNTTHTTKLLAWGRSFRLTQIHHAQFISRPRFPHWDSSAAWVQCKPAAEAHAARGPTRQLPADCAGELHPEVEKLLFSFFPRDGVDSLSAGVQLTHAAQRTPHPKIFREGSRGFASVDELI